MKKNKHYIYEYKGSDDNGKFTEKHYYRVEQPQRENLSLIGTCEVSPQYFSATQCKYYDGKEMYTRKEVNKAYLGAEQGSIEKGIIGDYFRLKFSYVPQLLKHFDKGSYDYYFPHTTKLKE
jgi:hypothetical protein